MAECQSHPCHAGDLPYRSGSRGEQREGSRADDCSGSPEVPGFVSGHCTSTTRQQRASCSHRVTLARRRRGCQKALRQRREPAPRRPRRRRCESTRLPRPPPRPMVGLSFRGPRKLGDWRRPQRRNVRSVTAGASGFGEERRGAHSQRRGRETIAMASSLEEIRRLTAAGSGLAVAVS